MENIASKNVVYKDLRQDSRFRSHETINLSKMKSNFPIYFFRISYGRRKPIVFLTRAGSDTMESS